jgi:hypothetical protein
MYIFVHRHDIIHYKFYSYTFTREYKQKLLKVNIFSENINLNIFGYNKVYWIWIVMEEKIWANVLILKIESKYDSIFSRNNFFFLGNNNNYLKVFYLYEHHYVVNGFSAQTKTFNSLVSNAFSIHCVRNHDTLRFIIICRATKYIF